MCCRSRLALVMATAVAVAALVRLAAQPTSTHTVDDARKAFDAPPDDARVMMRWWWFGPATTEAQIARDLEAMKRGGLGGAEIQPVYPLALDEPSGGVVNMRFLSDEYLGALRVANQRAGALGLRLDLTLGSGWPYGGPTIGIKDAASRLRLEKVVVGPGAQRVARPAMTTGETWIAAFVGPDGNTLVTPASMHPLTWPDDADAVTLPAAPHTRQVWFFIAGRTGMQVKRPAIGGEGYVLSHYDRGALNRYLDQVGTRLLTPFAGHLPFAIFCDSLEVYDSDWSPDLALEFATRRGYDVAPLLPVLAADRGMEGAMVREDWGRTLTELLDERFITPLATWARERGTRLRIQGYGIPPATVSSNAVADLPEGEGHQWRELTASRWASSASHLFDKPVASSETWTWLHSPSFRATPLDIKAEADRHFLQGITQLIGHGWPSTPEGEVYPGWRFYAAGVFNDRNPWWIAMPDISRYLQRVSAVLRQGRPGNDVALYLPVHDGYAHASLGKMHLLELVRDRLGSDVIGSILDAGYGFDLVDDRALAHHARIDGQALAIGAGFYRVVVVPTVEAMPAETLDVLARFVEAGGVVVATRQAPARPPGRSTVATRDDFAARAKALFTRTDGRATVAADAGAALRRALNDRVPPPIRVTSREAAASDDGRAVASEVGVIERRFGEESLFFVVNTSNVARPLTIGLGAPGRQVEWWNPLVDQKATLVTDAGGSVTLTLAPYQSGFLVRSTSAGQPGSSSTLDRAHETTTDARVLGPWQVTAGTDAWTATGASLAGWDQRESTRHFSGVATYETTVTLSAADVQKTRVWLDFGEGTRLAAHPLRNGYRAWLDGPIREAASVDVNGGRLVGAIWAPPYRIDITAAVHAGHNRIRIRVGNTAMNHMAGQSQPSYRLLSLRYGERFVPQEMDQVQVLPSGLTAPVRLILGN
jgi:alpha-L-rhamnosidase